MKKTLLLMAAAIALTASAAELSIDKNNQISLNKYTESTQVVDGPRAALSLNATTDITGKYVSQTFTSDMVQLSAEVEILQTATGYTVSGLVGTLPVNATFSNGVLTVPAGQVAYSHSSYGDAKLYVMVDDNHYNKNVNPTLALQEDGSFVLTNGVGFIMMLSGTYDGYNLGDVLVGSFAMFKANGTIKSNIVNSDWSPASTPTTSFTSTVMAADGQGVLLGVDGFGWVHFTYDADNAVQFANDSVYVHNDTYYAAHVTKGGNTATGAFGFLTGTGPTGTIDFVKGELTIGPWAFLMVNKTTGGIASINGRKSSSVVTFTPTTETAINDVNVEKTQKARKYIIDGQLIIEKDGVRYNVTGQVIK